MKATFSEEDGYTLDINQHFNFIISDIDDYHNTYTEHLSRMIAEDFDNMVVKFLEREGYVVERPFNKQNILDIYRDIESKGKFIDIINDVVYEDCKDGVIGRLFSVPFFNSLDNPVTEEEKKQILKDWIRNNDKN